MSLAASSATTAAIRSLNADFVRKGIVVSSQDDGGSATNYELAPPIQQLIAMLTSSCKSTGTRDLGEITSAIQLWKERSLHHTLQTLDQADRSGGGAALQTGHERHIQAIELHEKAGREVKEAVLRVIDGIVDTMIREINGFTVKLSVLIRELLKPELEDELMKERAITERLILERQRLMQDQVTVKKENEQLHQRVESLETDPEGGGDAILCRKLRAQVAILTQSQQAMDSKMAQMEHDHDQWRYEMTKMQTQLELQHKTLAMTRAMHDKETKQLVEMVYLKDDQFDQVKRATSAAAAMASTVSTATTLPVQSQQHQQHSLTKYDLQSGRTICYQSPQKAGQSSPNKSTRPILATIPSPATSPRTTPLKGPVSPNKRRTVSAPPRVAASINEPSLGSLPPGLSSPTARVHRPYFGAG